MFKVLQKGQLFDSGRRVGAFKIFIVTHTGVHGARQKLRRREHKSAKKIGTRVELDPTATGMDPTATDSVPTRAGSLRVHRWEPSASSSPPPLTVVTVHPWAPLGGSEYNTIGIAREMAAAGLRAVTFNMRSSSMVWGVLSNHSSEVGQVVDVCEWALTTFPDSKVLLLGSSAGAPQAGSALDKVPGIVGYAAVGYTFGWLSSIAFGRHFDALLKSSKPRLLIMGDRDEFTSESQLRSMLQKVKSDTPCESVIYPGCGHFELESPSYDGRVSRTVLEWIENRGLRGRGK